jgi:hypothetical protein
MTLNINPFTDTISPRCDTFVLAWLWLILAFCGVSPSHLAFMRTFHLVVVIQFIASVKVGVRAIDDVTVRSSIGRLARAYTGMVAGT